MAIAQLFFKKGNFIGTIELDVVISEGASASARITKNPVESGADINDHIIIDPMTFQMQGVVSDTKVNFLDAIGQLSSIEAATSVFTKTNSPSKEAWDELLDLHSSKTPFDLVQNLKTYSNVVLLTLSEIQDKDSSNALFFSATFSELILVGGLQPTSDDFGDSLTSDQAIPATDGGQKAIGSI